MKNEKLTRKDIIGAVIFFVVAGLLVGLGVWFEYAKIAVASAFFKTELKTIVIIAIVLRLLIAIIKVAKSKNS